MPVNIFEVDTVQTKLDNECTSVGLTIAQLICRYICLQYTWNRSYSGGMENRRMTNRKSDVKRVKQLVTNDKSQRATPNCRR